LSEVTGAEKVKMNEKWIQIADIPLILVIFGEGEMMVV